MKNTIKHVGNDGSFLKTHGQIYMIVMGIFAKVSVLCLMYGNVISVYYFLIYNNVLLVVKPFSSNFE